MPASSVRITMWTPPPWMSARRCKRSAARRPCWRRQEIPQAIGQTVGGLAPRGELVIIGVTADPLPISPVQLITPALSVSGHPSGTAREVEETMHFAVLSGVRARIEERPLSEAAEAYAAMEQGRARYRMVLTM